MMVRVKICGITNATDALIAAAAGADAIGFNFWPRSPRYVEVDRAAAIRMSLPPFVAAVGVFVDSEPDAVREVVERCGLDFVQLHGHETPLAVSRFKGLRIIKAIRIRNEADLTQLDKYDVNAFVLDSYVPGQPGGTGRTLDWDLVRAASSRAKIILAGGLRPDNVAEAVRAARPYAVDVASGVEDEPGKKSRKLLTEFIRAAKAVEL